MIARRRPLTRARAFVQISEIPQAEAIPIHELQANEEYRDTVVVAMTLAPMAGFRKYTANRQKPQNRFAIMFQDASGMKFAAQTTAAAKAFATLYGDRHDQSFPEGQLPPPPKSSVNDYVS